MVKSNSIRVDALRVTMEILASGDNGITLQEIAKSMYLSNDRILGIAYGISHATSGPEFSLLQVIPSEVSPLLDLYRFDTDAVTRQAMLEKANSLL